MPNAYQTFPEVAWFRIGPDFSSAADNYQLCNTDKLLSFIIFFSKTK